jgi:coenzyme PQQ biosynthesis protein C
MAVRPVDASTAGANLLSFDELRVEFRAVGEERYHHKHPFHLLMHEGRLSRGQLQAWALNRYYYQSIIPIKDSIILSRGSDPAVAETRRGDRSRTSAGTRRNGNPSRDSLRSERISDYRA